jgi:hypothetical protein
MVSIEILGVVKVEAKADELLTFVKELKPYLNKKSMRLTKNLLMEIDKIHLKIVEILSPLYGATHDDSKFENLFLNQYGKYKTNQLSDLSDVEFSCQRVQDELNKMTPSVGGWMRRLGAKLSEQKKTSLIQDQQKFANKVHDWYGSDKEVYTELGKLQKQLNKKLDQINRTYTENGVATARSQLGTFLGQSESSFQNFKNLRNNLNRVSNTL